MMAKPVDPPAIRFFGNMNAAIANATMMFPAMTATIGFNVCKSFKQAPSFVWDNFQEKDIHAIITDKWMMERTVCKFGNNLKKKGIPTSDMMKEILF